MAYTVALEVPPDLVIDEFNPFTHHDVKNDTFTVQWKDASVIERDSPDNEFTTLFHDMYASGQPVIGMRIERYSTYKQY